MNTNMRDLLELYVQDELSAEDRLRVERYLQDNPQAELELAEARQLIEDLNQTLGAGDIQAGDQLEEQILAKVGDEKSTPPIAGRIKRPPAWVDVTVGTLAACLLVGLGLWALKPWSGASSDRPELSRLATQYRARAQSQVSEDVIGNTSALRDPLSHDAKDMVPRGRILDSTGRLLSQLEPRGIERGDSLVNSIDELNANYDNGGFRYFRQLGEGQADSGWGYSSHGRPDGANFEATLLGTDIDGDGIEDDRAAISHRYRVTYPFDWPKLTRSSAARSPQQHRITLPKGTGIKSLIGVSGKSDENKRKLASGTQPSGPLNPDNGKTIKDKSEPAKPKPARRTWRKAKAVPNATRLQVGDRDELLCNGMHANVQVDGFRARVLLDIYYYNDRDRQLEGNFKIRLPDDASLYYFAFGETGFEYRPKVDKLTGKGFVDRKRLLAAGGATPKQIMAMYKDSWKDPKEAIIVKKEKAAWAYSQTVRRKIDPALVEWSGAGMFNARVFPLLPHKLHRIVIGYDVNLQRVDGDLVYKLDLPEGLPETVVDLNVASVNAAGSTAFEVEPEVKAVSHKPRTLYHYQNPQAESILLRIKDAGAVVIASPGNIEEGGRFFATRFTPNLPVDDQGSASSHALFLIDTSLSSNPDKFNIWLQLLKATLDKNRDSIKQFGVLYFNVDTHWWREGYSANTPDNVQALLADCNKLALEGATDVGAALKEAAKPVWRKFVKGKVARPDVFLLSDGALTWGESNLYLLARPLTDGNVGALFAYRTGLTGTASGVLHHLARQTGGAIFSVVDEQEVAKAARAHRHRPWQLLSVLVPGGEDVLVAGRPKSIYPNQSLTIVGRGTPDADEQIALKVRRGDVQMTVYVETDRTVESQMAARAYGQVAVGQLEDFRGATEEVAVAYARHFRVTGRNCSLLMLETEQDYKRFEIKPQEDRFVVKTSKRPA